MDDRDRRRHRRAGRRRPGGPWEPVWQGDSEVAATVVAGGLQAAGFETLTQGTDATAYARVRDGFGTWAVLAREDRAEAARAHLEDSGEAASVIRPGDEAAGPPLRATFIFVGVLVVGAAVAIALAEWL